MESAIAEYHEYQPDEELPQFETPYTKAYGKCLRVTLSDPQAQSLIPVQVVTNYTSERAARHTKRAITRGNPDWNFFSNSFTDINISSIMTPLGQAKVIRSPTP
jgi:hypothetical protein